MNFANLLGREIDEPLLQDAMGALGGTPSIDKFEDRTYYSLNASGLGFIFGEDNRLGSVQFFGQDRDPDIDSFKGDLPHGVKFSDTKAMVIAKLGKPEKQGAPMSSAILADARPWVRYLFDKHKLVLQFSSDESTIVLVELALRKVG